MSAWGAAQPPQLPESKREPAVMPGPFTFGGVLPLSARSQLEQDSKSEPGTPPKSEPGTPRHGTEAAAAAKPEEERPVDPADAKREGKREPEPSAAVVPEHKLGVDGSDGERAALQSARTRCRASLTHLAVLRSIRSRDGAGL
jgi:hypothetical protein